jgi:hypothetical protein
MAAVFSETLTETSHFATMRRDEQQQSPPTSQYRQPSRSQSRVPPSPRPQPTNTIAQDGLESQPTVSQGDAQQQPFASQQNLGSTTQPHPVGRYPDNSEDSARQEYSSSHNPAPLASPALSNSPISRSAWSSDDISRYGGTTIKVRDLSHIQTFANEDFLAHRSSGRRRAGSDPPLKYEISAMPITDIIEMVAGLLTKITTTNDRQHENLHRPMPTAEIAANMPGLTSSVLAFHGKNVPSITILSYLSRIHKYCPTTYEVFLSLLVYFDRMTERVNAGPMQEMRRGSSDRNYSRPSTGTRSGDEGLDMTRSASNSGGAHEISHPHYATPPDDDQIAYNLSHFFVVDSFNIHRLVIAGVTCASKFFSDVFYTNSRYAKVCLIP